MELLPPGVAIEIGSYVDDAQAGGDLEKAYVVGMQRSRRIEFLSGRFYARKALLELGHRAGDIPMASDRGPEWPAGIVGSITHTAYHAECWATAAVCQSGAIRALGIDMENCAQLDARAVDVVLSDAERAVLKRSRAVDRRRSAALIWCAKEAALKAARGVTDPLEVEIQLSESGAQFLASWRPATPARRNAAWSFEGRTAFREGYAFAAAYR
jgi:4'-phosphopantetheinyl transferase EntD